MRVADAPVPRRVVFVLALAVTAVGSAGVLVRLAEGVHPLAVAFWRTCVVTVLFLPLVRRFTRRDLGLALAAGALLALHFWAWFASLATVSVLRSTVLACLTPIWSGLLERVIFGQTPRPRFWIGIVIALAGVACLSGLSPGGWSAGDGPAVGDLLALVAGWLAAGYLVIGRAGRQNVEMGTWGALLCGGATLWLFLLAWLVGAPLTGFAPASWMALAGLALGPQLTGHMGFNYAVRYVPAAIVGAVILLEPVLGAALAAVILDERPGWRELLGAAIIIVGVYVAVSRPKTPGAGGAG